MAKQTEHIKRGQRRSCPQDIQPKQLHTWLESGQPVQLLDVREDHEYERCRIPGATLIPLGKLGARLDDLDRTLPVVAYCHYGGRSAKAARLLANAGFAQVHNLAGGIEAWAQQIDASVPRY